MPVALSSENMSPTTVKLDSETKKRLQSLAKARRRTAHSLLLEAIETFLERQEEQERLKKEALAAFREYELTGLHVTQDEADQWLAKLEKGQYEAPPECHP